MEKKVPERKVSLRDEDIFYVYDKRINKCIKEDCEGIVKYGLVLRVHMSEEETCNCFECNKCHMKYTPYPNYVRLSKTDMLTIYNKDEVDARDRKRAEDALKQAARDKRKQQGRRFTPKRDTDQGTEGRPYERKPYAKKPYERKSYENKPYEKKPYEKKSYENKPYEKNSYAKRTYENKPYEPKSYEHRSYEKKPYEPKSFESRSFDKRSYDRKPYDSRRNNYTSDAKRASEGNGSNGERRKSNIVITNGNYRKPYSDQKRSYGSYKNRYE